MKKPFVVTLLLMAALLMGCAGNTPAPSAAPSETATQAPTATPALEQEYPITVTDSLGREVTLTQPPQVIVSLTPTNTEIVFALGAGDRVAGVDIVSNYPPEVDALPDVGDFSGPSIEAIAGLKPDLILSANNLQGDAIDRLTELGLTVAAVEASQWDDIPATIEMVGALIGRPQAAAALNQKMAEDLAAITDAVAGAQPVSVYYVFSYGEYGNWTTGPGTFIDTMITLAGGESVTRDAPARWLEYNMEDIVRKNPSVFLVSSDLGDIESLSAAEGYKELDAVKEGRVYLVDADKASRPGPRIIEGLEEIARAIHPECFE
ncbi:MAG: ABC transporter substrate-binding protein [Clostridiales bacterium]|nr:ABC transporter substrate-binding protein [Clostridiales bacterium]